MASVTTPVLCKCPCGRYPEREDCKDDRWVCPGCRRVFAGATHFQDHRDEGLVVWFEIDRQILGPLPVLT